MYIYIYICGWSSNVVSCLSVPCIRCCTALGCKTCPWVFTTCKSLYMHAFLLGANSHAQEIPFATAIFSTFTPVLKETQALLIVGPLFLYAKHSGPKEPRKRKDPSSWEPWTLQNNGFLGSHVCIYHVSYSTHYTLYTM